MHPSGLSSGSRVASVASRSSAESSRGTKASRARLRGPISRNPSRDLRLHTHSLFSTSPQKEDGAENNTTRQKRRVYRIAESLRLFPPRLDDLRLCVECEHCSKPPASRVMADPKKNARASFDYKCDLFVRVDRVTREEHPCPVVVARSDAVLCGPMAKFFRRRKGTDEKP